ncbi:MAG: nicotinate-nucleotide adenylyltransferase [Isosphaeraceae bacterium]
MAILLHIRLDFWTAVHIKGTIGENLDGDKANMRLGIFGGTFDPIHLGHLILAESCREACELDRVWFVVAGFPPHKPGARVSASDRVEMARLAIAGHPTFEVSEIEAKRPGPHYSVETLEAIRQERPDDDLFFLIGADSLTDLPSWRSPQRIAELAALIVVNRPGLDAIDSSVPPDFGPAARPILRVTIPSIGIASRDLRKRLLEGRSIRYQVPRGVEAYIDAQRLYRNPGDERTV